MNIAIRAATEADAAEIGAIVRHWKSDGRPTATHDSNTEHAVRLCVQSPMCEVRVGEADGRVLGYVVVHWIPFPAIGGSEGYISDLVVERTARGNGLGTRLLACVEKAARARGIQRLMLNNRISSESFAREFYPKQGFQQRENFANFVKVLD